MTATAETRQVRLIEPQKADAVVANYYDKSWGMVIGINDYLGEHPTLGNARNDAAAFADLLRTQYKFEQVYTLYDHEATCDTIMAWLRDRLPAQIGRNDRLVIFFAGHGTTRESSHGEKRGYLIPHDAQAGKYADYIDMTELRDACGWIRAKHILLVLDCCFSGVAAITSRSTPAVTQRVMTDSYLQEITRRTAWQVLTAGASDELAADSGSRPGHSAFTSALLAGLEGQADQNGDGIITASELAGFVKPEVSRQSMGGRARGQTPFFNYLAGSDQGDFVFIRHDTVIKIAPPPGGAGPVVATTKSLPVMMGLLALLFVAVGLLGWFVWNSRLKTVDPTVIYAEQTKVAVAFQTQLAPTLAWIAQQSGAVKADALATITAEAATTATALHATNTAVAAQAEPTALAAVPPPATPTPPLPTATPPAQRQATAFLYDTRAGDTWATIAAQYGLTAAELKAYNPVWLECVDTLNTACRTEPKAGDDILIPSLTGETLIGRGTTYTIKAGENLFRIGVRSGYAVAALLAANQDKIPNPDAMRSGTVLYIPRTGELIAPVCTLVSNPPLQVGDQGRVCLATGPDLGLRDAAGGSRVLARLKNGTRFTVRGGPTCAYYSYAKTAYFWWQVETADGQRGWLVDGSDTQGDPVYLCRVAGAAPVDEPTPTPVDGDVAAQRISAEVVQAITNYWSLWGSTAGCLTAWGMLSDSFKRNTSALTQTSYLADCGKNQAEVAQVYDLDATSAGVVERRGYCVLVRVQLAYNGLTDITFALMQSAPTPELWQIYVANRDHQQAQARADEVCQ